MRALLTLALVAAVLTPRAHAQNPRPQEKALTRPENWGLTFGLEGLSALYDPAGNQPYNYGTRGNGINLNAGLVFLRNFIFGAEIGTYFFHGDKDLISQGSHYTAETTNSLAGSVYAGVVTSPIGRSPKMGRKWWAGLMAGQSKWSGERRMDQCVGCVTDRVRMISGLYAEPFVMFGGGDHNGGGGFRLGYRQYLRKGRTLQSAISLGVFFDFIKL